MRTFVRILTFVLVGPPVGMLILFSGTALYDGLTRGIATDLSAIPGSLVSPQMLAMCYFFGGIPALLDGIFASILARRVAGPLLYFWIAAVGAAVSIVFVCWVILGGSRDPFDPMRPWVFVVIIAATGGGAGVVSLGVFDGITRARRRRAQPA
jgi:hypothetical protein